MLPGGLCRLSGRDGEQKFSIFLAKFIVIYRRSAIFGSTEKVRPY